MIQISLPWLNAPSEFPSTAEVMRAPYPEGLLAASHEIDAEWLMACYPKGIFPWYSEGEPVLWWSTAPRAVLYVDQFRVHRSLRKTLNRLAQCSDHEIRMDFDFEQTIRACAQQVRRQQHGTWISEDIISAYTELHRRGFAHSIEHWCANQLIGGLYCVSFGSMVFGESMFAKQPDASKVAFACFVAWLKRQGVRMIDCQQATSHLMSLGAVTLERADFEQELGVALAGPALSWSSCTLEWPYDPT